MKVFMKALNWSCCDGVPASFVKTADAHIWDKGSLGIDRCKDSPYCACTHPRHTLRRKHPIIMSFPFFVQSKGTQPNIKPFSLVQTRVLLKQSIQYPLLQSGYNCHNHKPIKILASKKSCFIRCSNGWVNIKTSTIQSHLALTPLHPEYNSTHRSRSGLTKGAQRSSTHWPPPTFSWIKLHYPVVALSTASTT